MFKLKFYYTQGVNKGNLHHEEHFTSIDEMAKRYREICKMEEPQFRPVAWRITDGGREKLMFIRETDAYIR